MLKDKLVTKGKGSVFDENEVLANLLVSNVMIIVTAFMIVCWLLNRMGIFLIDDDIFDFASYISILLLIVPAFICYCLKGNRRWIKYFLLLSIILSVSLLQAFFTYVAIILMCIPVVLSVRYYSKELTIATAVLSLVFSFFALFIAVIFRYGLPDLNMVHLVDGTSIVSETAKIPLNSLVDLNSIDKYETFKESLQYGFLPNSLMFALVSTICTISSMRGRDIVHKQDVDSRKNERINTELSLASEIQIGMLPEGDKFYPDNKQFSICATMNPAKEVGGDFYDFFFVDDDNLALVIGDVSDKGIPASLFMVVTKTLIKDHAILGLSPKEVFTCVNERLCMNNEMGLFVTAWLGIINLKTGVMSYANAGHNPPLICSDGKAEFIRDRHGFVLAGLDSTIYEQNTITLKRNDRLVLYTDGVTDAKNGEDELFGEDRLKDAIEKSLNLSVTEVIGSVDNRVNEFVKETPQFDDMTMLVFDYNEDVTVNERQFPAEVDELHSVLGFVDEILEERNCNMRAQMAIDVAVEELFVNIASYAYRGKEKGQVTITVKSYEDEVEILLIDDGIPFNPVDKDDPDVTLSAEERDIGGLGIFMVKKSMDEFSYQRIDEKNIVKLRKVIH